MDSQANTAFARFLRDAAPADDAAQIAQAWFDQTVTYCLSGGAGLARPGTGAGVGGHLRRSFLGALGRGASSEARQNRPCPWDPPCALDVFMREQLRGPRGDGLPKPYVIFTTISGDDLLVSLRVFGAANDWFNAAAEAMLAGMREILPCQRLFGRDLPPVSERRIARVTGLAPLSDHVRSLRVEFISPVDATGKGGPIEASLLSRLLRRVDGLARWQGLALPTANGRTLARQIAALDYRGSKLVADAYFSPNRKHQQRRHPTLSGTLAASGDLTPLLPIFAIGERCHIGRAAIEGLGRYRLLIGA